MAKRPFDIHAAAIRAGVVTKTNVIGLRKALNSHEREVRGYSISSTAPRITKDERFELLNDLLPAFHPVVTGELHDSGVKLLQSPRYRKQLAPVAEIVADIDRFELVGFDYVGQYGLNTTPVYRCHGRNGKAFNFTNLAWQSGGNGPVIMSNTY